MVRNYKRKTERLYVRDGFYSNTARAERKANPRRRGRPPKLLDASTDTEVAAWDAFRKPETVVYLPHSVFSVI